MRFLIDGKVKKVIDGDTIDVEIRRTIRVRLLDCWAPETRTRDKEEKERGLLSKEFLTRIARGQPVEVDIPIEGDERFGEAMSFGRVLARVRTKSDDRDLSSVMVAGGFATKTRDG